MAQNILSNYVPAGRSIDCIITEITRCATQITPAAIERGILSDMFVPGTSVEPLLILVWAISAIDARAFDTVHSRINSAATANVALGPIEYFWDILLPAPVEGFCHQDEEISFSTLPNSYSVAGTRSLPFGKLAAIFKCFDAWSAPRRKPHWLLGALQTHLSVRSPFACRFEKHATAPAKIA